MLRTLVLSVCSLLFICCGDGLVATKPQDIIFPDSNVSYQRHVLPLMTLGCAFSNCHGAGTTIPLDSYVSFFQTAGLIIPMKPENSRLTQVINGTLSHTYSLSQSITENHKRGMNAWIREGAKNN